MDNTFKTWDKKKWFVWRAFQVNCIFKFCNFNGFKNFFFIHYKWLKLEKVSLAIKNKVVVSIQVLDLYRLDKKNIAFLFAFEKLIFNIVVNIREFLGINDFNFIIIFKKAIKALVFEVVEEAFYLWFEIIGIKFFSCLNIP